MQLTKTNIAILFSLPAVAGLSWLYGKDFLEIIGNVIVTFVYLVAIDGWWQKSKDSEGKLQLKSWRSNAVHSLGCALILVFGNYWLVWPLMCLGAPTIQVVTFQFFAMFIGLFLVNLWNSKSLKKTS